MICNEHIRTKAVCHAPQHILLKDRPAVRFDVLSVNVGISPASEIPGVSEFTTPVKPIDGFVTRLEVSLAHSSDRARHVVGTKHCSSCALGCHLALHTSGTIKHGLGLKIRLRRV